jgi:hypothetical protein
VLLVVVDAWNQAILKSDAPVGLPAVRITGFKKILD